MPELAGRAEQLQVDVVVTGDGHSTCHSSAVRAGRERAAGTAREVDVGDGGVDEIARQIASAPGIGTPVMSSATASLSPSLFVIVLSACQAPTWRSRAAVGLLHAGDDREGLQCARAR